MRDKRLYTIIVIAILIVILSVVCLLFFKKEDNSVVLKDNVAIITEDTDDIYKPYLVEDQGLFFKENPEYAIGDVLVSGVTEEAPYGYVRKVISIKEIFGEYYYYTEPATLLDVFEEAHIRETIELTPDMKALSGLSSKNQVAYDEEKLSGIIASTLFSNTEDVDNGDMKDLFVISHEEDNEETGHVECEVGIKLWIDFELDIEDEELEWGMSANARIHGDMLFGFSESQEKEYKKELLRKILPTITIWAGPVPIVITNQVTCQLETETVLEGFIGSSIRANSTLTAGFLYTSRDNNVQEDTVQLMKTGGMEWDSSAKVEGKANAGFFVYLTTLLYDSTGAHIGLGLEGQVDGSIELDTLEKFQGELNLAIYPQAKGYIVVEIPVVSENLVEIPIFEKSFEPLWEAHFPEKENHTDENTDEKPIWYQVYADVIEDCKKLENTTSFTLRERYFYDWDIVEEDELGGVGFAVDKTNKEIVYLLNDINENGIPELVLGLTDGVNTDIVTIYAYYKDKDMVDCISSLGYGVDEIYLVNEENKFFEALGSGGKFIILNKEGETLSSSEYNEQGNDLERFINTDELEWNYLVEWN